jgi:outer membrane protein assembly factor BamA
MGAQTLPSLEPPREAKKSMFTAFPVFYYTPETRFAAGLTGLSLFNFRHDSIQAAKSSLSLLAVYTQNKQWLFSLPFNLFVKNRTYLVYGELTYNRFNYNFYGVGNQVPESFSERYGVKFPRVRVSALKKIVPHFYAGLRYAFDNYSLYDLDSAGLLITREIPGSNGGKVSGAGVVTMWDDRDNIFFPSKGTWAEFVVYHDNPLTGSDFKYTRLALDLSHYFNYRNHILALNLYSLYSDSDLPFFQMATLGGQKRMRGYYEGRYRDNNALLLQAEYRRMVWGPFGFAVFISSGQVAHRYADFNASDWRTTLGAGLRVMLDPQQKITIRLDAAVGNGKILPYFTVGEAF